MATESHLICVNFAEVRRITKSSNQLDLSRIMFGRQRTSDLISYKVNLPVPGFTVRQSGRTCLLKWKSLSPMESCDRTRYEQLVLH